MCTVIILRRPDHDWPLILGANRDEMGTRLWRPPGRHWPDRPDVVAGQDQLAGGSWLGLNDTGVVAGILNRKDSLGPDERLRSRGELVLEALDHADAVDAAIALSKIDPAAYRSFNIFVADNRDAFWLRSVGPEARRVEKLAIPPGLSMLTAWDMNSPDSARTRLYRPLFDAAPPPDPDSGNWSTWEELLSAREVEPGAGPGEAMFITTGRGFGTLSSSIIALGSTVIERPRNFWRFRDSANLSRGFANMDL